MTRAALAPSSAAASIHLPIQSRSRLLLGRMGDVAVVDQERRERDAGVGERGADFAEIGRVAAFKMKMAKLQMIDAAREIASGRSMSDKLRLSPFLLRLAEDVVAGRVRMKNAEGAMHAPARDSDHGNFIRHRCAPELLASLLAGAALGQAGRILGRAMEAKLWNLGMKVRTSTPKSRSSSSLGKALSANARNPAARWIMRWCFGGTRSS